MPASAGRRSDSHRPISPAISPSFRPPAGSRSESAGSLLLTAFCGGRLVGNLGLDPVGPMRKVRHRASVGLAVVRDCWGQGLGTILLEEALQAARQLGYEQVELEVLAPNQRGLALYERAGFVAYGRRERAVCQKDGRYEAEILMYKTL